MISLFCKERLREIYKKRKSQNHFHIIITEDTKIELGKFLTFRHFFIHAYGFMLNEEELKPLIDLAPKAFLIFP